MVEDRGIEPLTSTMPFLLLDFGRCRKCRISELLRGCKSLAAKEFRALYVSCGRSLLAATVNVKSVLLSGFQPCSRRFVSGLYVKIQAARITVKAFSSGRGFRDLCLFSLGPVGLLQSPHRPEPRFALPNRQADWSGRKEIGDGRELQRSAVCVYSHRQIP